MSSILKTKNLISAIFLLALYLLSGNILYAQLTEPVSTNNWYVGNTASGEWIKYKKVWLARGDYRFSMQGVAATTEQTVHLEIGNQHLPSVSVPTNTDYSFEYFHLGHITLNEGYYDIKLVFETGNVNCDNIFIKKDANTSNGFMTTDTIFSINRTDGMHVAPIGDHAMASATLKYVGKRNAPNSFKDANGVRYSQEQIFAYNSQPIYEYTPRFTDQAMDIWVAELVAAKVDFVFMHGRGQRDFDHQVEDRAYKPADGVLDPRYLDKFVEAVNRSPYAKGNIKLGYFQDNGAYPREYQNSTGIRGRWGDEPYQDWCYNYSFKPWFTAVPKGMLYHDADGKVPVQLWTADGNYDYSHHEPEDTMILEYLQYIEQKVKADFGEDIRFVLSDSFWKNGRDPRTKDYAGGVQGWFSWGGLGITEIKELNGKKYAFAVNGKRFPFNQAWLSDWDPETNTGTLIKKDGNNFTDYFVSSLNPDSSMAVEPVFVQGRSEGAEWIVLESWCDWAEGTTWYRSDHKTKQAWPNQHISFLRKYADTACQSIVLEAEACDEFLDHTPGNAGGAFRINWYQNESETDLDVYRPLHKLVNVANVSKPSGTDLTGFSVGFEDFWGFHSDGKVSAHEVDGYPVNWKSGIARPITGGVKDIAVGRYYAWAISNTDNKVMQCELPTGGFTTEVNEAWKDVTDGLPMKDIDLNIKEAWGIDEDGILYHRDYDGEFSWKRLDSAQQVALVSLTADENFIWGFDSEGNIQRVSSSTGKNWEIVSNPYNITKIDAGGGEVWGVNANNEVYRTEVSGLGEWEYVCPGIGVAVGYNFAWVQADDGTFTKYQMQGFNNKSVFAEVEAALPVHVVEFNAVADGNKAKLSWQTENAVPGSKFDLLRSTLSAREDFKPLSTETKNNPTKQSGQAKEYYTYYDNTPYPGMNYYKLVETSPDGQSKVIAVKPVNFLNTNLSVVVYPNPITGSRTVKVKITGYTGEKVALALYDIAGREIIHTQNYNYSPGAVIQLKAGQVLKSGVYLLRLTGDNIDRAFKLIAK